ncbi:Telomeric repeat-binding factor 2 [compost metagenome]
MIQTSLVDGDGYKYTIAITTSVKNQLDGSVAAGRKLRGEVAYEVPKDATGLEFIFSDPFTNGQAIWTLE